MPGMRTAKEIDEDAEAFAQLAELVATGEGFDFSDTDEYIEGLAQGVDKGLLQKLKRGDFSLQAHLDLHGLLADAAKLELERFLTESRRRGHRCVLVIHGRGLHSKDQEPVLKNRMSQWLARGKLARIVLAFATAKQSDGGTGAVYVLLRR
jgi:DNA-nicking Smr family endonuclease